MALIDDILAVTSCGINSIKMNAAVQSKVNNKRLELGETKCFQMHVGCVKPQCPTLKVQSLEMSTSNRERYLGDILSTDGKIEENLKERVAKGNGIVNQILGLLDGISFGEFYFEMALLFRNSLLINGILYNMEALHGFKKKHLDIIEECDKNLMRRLFNCPDGTPTEAFFLETSAIPIRFILMGRRIMYYWTILNKSEDELVRRVFDAQKTFKTKDSWVAQVEEDLEFCNIELQEEEIKLMSNYKMKKLVSKQIRIKSDEYLIELRDSHEKTACLCPSNQMQDYLKCMNISKKEKILLFKLRTWMIQVKGNFSSSHINNMQCGLCGDKESEETQLHLLQCNFLVNHPDIKQDISKIKYEDIFKDLSSQVNAIKVWTKIMSIRKVKLGIEK